VLGVAAGLVGVSDIRSRAALIDNARGGPRADASSSAYRSPADAALTVYQSLADADASIAGSYLTGESESGVLHARYRTDIAQATAALTMVAASTDSTAVADLSTYLPLYSGQVDDAVQASLRPGLDSDLALLRGAARLRESAVLYRDKLLPASKGLYEEETARLTASQVEAAQFPLFALGLGVVLVACLVVVQIYLKRRTKRLFNVGLVLATAAALGTLAWLGIVWTAAAGHSEASRRDGTAPVEALVAARVAGLRARADEAMTLIARGNGPDEFDKSFDATAEQLTRADGLLARAKTTMTQPETRAAVGSAADAFQNWLSVHRELRRLDSKGEAETAVSLATATDQNGSAGLAMTYDDQLGQATNQATGRLHDSLQAAHDALSAAGIVVALLMALVVLGALAGMLPRITEYYR